MNHAKIFAGIVLATTLISGCASYSTSDETSAVTVTDYNSALADAKKSIQAAKKANYEWRDSGKMLKKSGELAKSGDYAAATKLANKAKRQGDMALAQSKEQANAGPH